MSTTQGTEEHHRRTPTFLLELPLVVNEHQARRIRGHLDEAEAAPLERPYSIGGRAPLGLSSGVFA